MRSHLISKRIQTLRSIQQKHLTGQETRKKKKLAKEQLKEKSTTRQKSSCGTRAGKAANWDLKQQGTEPNTAPQDEDSA
jgi:hypothetical protein